MDKLKMHSPNLTQDNMARIRELFPGCVTEAQGEDGQLRLAVDFDQLRQELSESIVEGAQERYHLNWPGKREALLTANAPIAKTLRPCREESVDFDTTQNLFIEGDNLDALKLLQETYLGKVKMIYIDPPYNTGNDFIYEDDFAENTDEFLKRSNQKDADGNRLVANTESNGRFHSDWLSMIYPRLKLAKNTLAEDGVIFISIDDVEVANLMKLADEIFGSENFISTIAWQKTLTRRNDAKLISNAHEHIVIYAKNINNISFNKLPPDNKQRATYTNRDNDSRGDWLAIPFHAPNLRPNLTYPITTPSGRVLMPPAGRCWSTTKEKFEELKADNRIYFGKDGGGMAQRKKFWSESDNGMVAWTWWSYEFSGENREATKELKDIFDENNPFSAPKPTKLLRNLFNLASSNRNEIILDFFAGSATTAHAVMQLNAEDGGNRQFIMVQLPEPTPEKSEARKAGYDNIAEISKERIRRAGKKIKESLATESTKPHENDLFDDPSDSSVVKKDLDIGFRVLKVDTSNIEDVYYTPDEINQDQLGMFTDNIKADRTPEDLLFQVLLDWGVDLTLPIRKEIIQGKTIFFVNHEPYDLIACFDKNITEDLIRELTQYQPLRVVFRDNGFASDAVKINAEQLFKQMSPGTDVKAI